MSLALFYDTETTGFPVWKEPSESPEQPHMVEVAALAVCLETKEIVHSLNLIIRPDGWVIPPEATEIHSITTERALAVGVPEAFASECLFRLWLACSVRVGFNESFDARIMRIAFKRFMGEDAAESFKAGPAECVMRQAQKVQGGRVRKLGEVYEEFCGKPLDGAHSAYNDASATASAYWAIRPKYLAATAA